MSRTVNSSADLDPEARGVSSLAPAVTRAAAIFDVLAEKPAEPTALSDLGRRLAELGGAYLATVDQVQEFYELADRLPVASEETTQMAVLDGLEVTYVARHDGRQPIRLASEIGRRLPASCTALGKAALASLDPADLAGRRALCAERHPAQGPGGPWPAGGAGRRPPAPGPPAVQSAHRRPGRRRRPHSLNPGA